MKKLNRKGFTLIELLAVIVILAIIVVVTVPTVLNSVNSAKQSTFDTSANTVEEWFEKQYALYQIGSDVAGEVDADFANWCKPTADGGTNGCQASTGVDITSLLNKAGVKASNYSTATAYKNGTRFCVSLTASNDGDFGNVGTKTASSLGCE